MWAVCRASIHRAAIQGEHPDDVYPLVEILVMHGSRAEQRYSSIDKDHKQSQQQHQTPLMLFAIAGAVDCAKLLLKTGASIMTCDGEGWTPLMIACAPNSPRVNHENKDAVASNDEMIEMLLEHKAQVNAQNSTGLSALHCACQSGDIHSAALLIHAGAKLNLRSSNGFSPIVWALIGAKGDTKSEIVQIILDACLTTSTDDNKKDTKSSETRTTESTSESTTENETKTDTTNNNEEQKVKVKQIMKLKKLNIIYMKKVLKI
eukprot:CAMPEP_0174818816 /NCGR_PEP_ID=MMETSP1107-20130205/1717_1 /TAXON_ID=36770 /ORGANISM="Paraphysomonas vestita, Strain GFlagA" /LENGTH=261 /DNA_ID=CAMNT_0016031263 /DNA_START=740 /DNA_END=1526 /DNA_ORIENTATION=-